MESEQSPKSAISSAREELADTQAKLLEALAERQRATDSLQAAQHSAQLLIETANDAVVTIDESSVIVGWNATAERMFGWTAKEALGCQLTDLIVPERNREQHRDGMARFLRNRTPGILNRRIEVSALSRSGKELQVELSVWPVEFKGTFTFSSFIRDISDRKRAEAAMRTSEERYRAVVENSNEGIFVSQDGCIRFANAMTLAIIGYSQQEIVSKPFVEMIHPDDRARIHSNYMRRVRGEDVENYYTFRVLTARGDIRTLRLNAVLIEWEGRPAILNFVADVTETLELQSNLREVLAEREAILQTTAVGIMLTQNGKIKWINQTLETTMLGWTSGETIDRSVADAFHFCMDWGRFLDECIPELSATAAFHAERELRRRNNSVWWCQISARAQNALAPEAGTMWFFVDISTRKNAEENIRRSLERERELSDLKSRFIAMTSHEFRTPLAAILASVELLNDFSAKLPEEGRADLVQMVRNSVNRMTEMIEQVLFIGKEGAAQPPISRVPTNVREFLSAVVAEMPTGSSQVDLVLSDIDEPHLIDQRLMRHSLSNLLSNAIKYSSEGCRVQLGFRRKSAHLIFQVSDSGIGIPDEDQQRLFQTFYRGSNVGAIEGSGLGLSIVRHCVSAHGGNVTFFSRPGQGTEFTISIPSIG